VEVKGKQTKALECKLLGGVGYALFAELIPLFGNSWTFDNAVPRLAIEK
jgi:hypothetical protein